jgi:hypothetical protein
VSVGRQLQLLHSDFGCWSIKVFQEHMSYTGSLLALCPERRPVPVEIRIYDAAKRAYSGSRVLGPLPNVTTLTDRVGSMLNRLFKCLRAPPCLRK